VQFQPELPQPCPEFLQETVCFVPVPSDEYFHQKGDPNDDVLMLRVQGGGSGIYVFKADASQPASSGPVPGKAQRLVVECQSRSAAGANPEFRDQDVRK
jgi:hypothetical protein